MPGSNQIQRALAEALKTAPVLPRDGAGVALAKRYAELLDRAHGGADEAKVTADLGPKFKDLLTALGMTPAGRTDNKKETPDGPVPGADELALLRAERARANGA